VVEPELGESSECCRKEVSTCFEFAKVSEVTILAGEAGVCGILLV
jgi:hypothetical protein